MNKRHTGKLLAFLLAVVFMFTLVPQVFADGEGVPINDKVFIHNSDGSHGDPNVSDYSDGFKSILEGLESTLSITGPDNQPIDLSGAGPHEIPEGSKIDLEIAFHFSDAQGHNAFYVPNNFFTYSLPVGLNFSDTGPTPLANDSGPSFADWKIEGNELKVVLNQNVNSLEPKSDMWGSIGVEGQFVWQNEGGEEIDQREITILGQTYTFNREEVEEPVFDATKTTVSKSFVSYDAENGYLNWEVVITPPQENLEYDYRGHKFIDTLTGPHTFTEDGHNFAVDGVAAEAGSITIDTDGKSLTYDFPQVAEGNEPVEGPLRLTYRTEMGPGEFSEEKTFSNKAFIQDSQGKKSNEDGDSFGMSEFVQKTSDGGFTIATIDEEERAVIRWIVKITLPQTSSPYTFPNAKILDKLFVGGADHNFIENDDTNYPVMIKYPGDTSADKVSNDRGSVVFEDGGDGTNSFKTLTYSFPSGHPTSSVNGPVEYELSYYTSAKHNYIEQIPVQNEAWFVWGGSGGPGPGGEWNIGQVGIEKLVGKEGGILSKSSLGTNKGAYDHSENHNYIKWEVVVNDYHILMDNLTLTDEVMIGHALVVNDEHKLTIQPIPQNGPNPDEVVFDQLTESWLPHAPNFTSYSLKGAVTDEEFTTFELTFPKSDNKYVIVFYTKITDEKLAELYKNSPIVDGEIQYETFENKVTLSGYEIGKTLSATADKKFKLTMLTKKAKTFDYATRELTYELKINSNRLPMPEDTKILETIPSQLVLKEDSFRVDVVSEVEARQENNKTLGEAGIDIQVTSDGFELTLPYYPDEYENVKPGDSYTITYVMHLEDDAHLISPTNPVSLTFTNHAKLALGTLAEIIAEDEKTITYETLTKTYEYDGGDIIHWSIGINPGQVELDGYEVDGEWVDIVLTDKLDPNLTLEGGIYLYEAVVNSQTGKLTRPSEAEPVGTGDYDEDTRILSISLPLNEKKAYILEFSTEINKNNVTINNTIELKGFVQDGPIEAKIKPISVKNRYSSSGTGGYQLSIKKLGTEGELLDGAVFKLFYLDDGVYVAYKRNNQDLTADSVEGIATFDNIPYWKFYVLEVEPPGNYIRSPEHLGPMRPSPKPSDEIHLEIRNEPALADEIKLNKLDANGEGLNEGEFGIYKKGDDIAPVQTRGAQNGEVIFTDIPRGQYIVREITAPPGFLKKHIEFEVHVEYNNDKTGVEVIYVGFEEGLPTFVNDFAGKITVIKTGASGPLSGVTFQLYGKLEGSTEPVLLEGQSETTATNGVVVFDELPLGTYYVKETAAPSGYHLNTTLHEVVLTADSEIGDDDEPINGWEQTLELRNYLLTDSVILTKTDPNGVALDGGWFGIFSNEEATGEPLDKVQADGGQIVFSGLLPGAYYVRELEAPAGYIKSDKIIKVGVSVSGNSIAGEVVKEPLVNTWAGGIKLVKVDEKDEPLAGAVFELLDTNKKVIKEGTSGKDGVIEFKELAMGTYYLREKTAPAGYAKLMELTEVVLKAGAEADMVKTVKLANHRNLASVTLRKTNQYDGLVSGGLFGIYKTDDTGFKNPLQKVASVKGMIIFTDLEAGQYFIREIEAPKHHKRTDEFVKVVLEVNPDTGLLEDVEIEEPLLNETPLTEEEWDEIVEGDEDEKENGEKDDDLVETGGFLDTAMLWFFGTLLILAGAIMLLRMRAALVRK